MNRDQQCHTFEKYKCYIAVFEQEFWLSEKWSNSFAVLQGLTWGVLFPALGTSVQEMCGPNEENIEESKKKITYEKI